MSKLMPYKKLLPAEKKSTGNETVIDLIYNFLNEPSLRALSNLSIGGTFPVSDFLLGKGCYAKQFWYCYDKNQPTPQQQVFLAIEDSWNGWPRNRKESEIPTTPESETLRKPLMPFTFDDKNFDRTDITQVDRFIQQHKNGNQLTQAISRNEVKQFGKAFIENFGGKEENKEFCYYPLAYFENFTPETRQCVIDDFMKLGDVHYVRYYFGLDTSKGHRPNRIRVVLFPVGKDQRRLVGTSGVNNIIQQSWPPPFDFGEIFEEIFGTTDVVKKPNGIEQEEYNWASELESTTVI
jgi:hypothetical protein